MHQTVIFYVDILAIPMIKIAYIKQQYLLSISYATGGVKNIDIIYCKYIQIHDKNSSLCFSNNCIINCLLLQLW